jgi:hypothetical protein
VARKLVRIGLDFDGVITYNPLRVARVGIAFVKHDLLKIKKLGFFMPKNDWQKLLFRMAVVWPSVFPANGITVLKEMSKRKEIELYLVTGRFDFVKKDTYRWLKYWGVEKIFKLISVNEKYDQPHEFKLGMCKKWGFDYFIEDNWDIVNSLTGKTKSKIFWIYNIFDRNRNYPHKFSDLKTALEKIKHDENIV